MSLPRRVQSRRNLEDAWDKALREHTDPKTGEVHGFKVVFADGSFIFHFGSLETLSRSLIRERGSVIEAEPMGYQEATKKRTMR